MKITPDEKGRITVGLTADGDAALKRLMETGWFQVEMDAYKVAISVALARGIDVRGPLTGVTTKFNVGGLDRDGKLARAIRMLGSEKTVSIFDYAERLADAGIRVLATKLIDQEETLSQVLGLDASLGPPAEPAPSKSTELPT